MTKSGSLRRFAPNISNSQGNSDVPIADANLRPATRCARVVHEPFAQGKQRAQGMPGAQCTRSLACEKKHTSVVTTVTPESPGIPYAMVLTAYFVLSPVIELYCHRHPADMALSAPGRADFASAGLDAGVEASGPHDFAVRTCVVRQRAVDCSRTFRSALPSHRAPNAAASTASHPASVTIAIRPSRGTRQRGL
jgi:hypothetical protein